MSKKQIVTPVPEPVPAYQVCSVCGESWTLHIADENGDVPVTECIRVLKSLRFSGTQTIHQWPYQWPWTSTPTITYYSTGGNINDAIPCSSTVATN